MEQISKSAIAFAALLYLVVASYFWYLSYALWLFLGKNYFPQNVSSVLSIQNSNFGTVNLLVASGMTLICMVAVWLSKGLRQFLLEAGDELSRVAWPTLQEAQRSTAIVLLLVLVVGFFLFFADSIFLRLVNLILSSA